jgi:chemotaxis methyl-accepting protein methylase/PAS domain-containing protein
MKSKSSKATPATDSSKVTVVNTPPIVAIGASAGGLEALESFFAHVPPSSGIAFVVIQHLDPTREGILPELLQRATPMKVKQAGNRMKVRPDCVYVIKPNKDLSILHGSLFLLDPVDIRGLRLPIDFFFRSLADDQHERAVGVILSGMGSDGTRGLRAIKENAGLAVVQSPESAGFDSMPRSAIEAGLADIVAPVEELPGQIIAFMAHIPRSVSANPEPILELKSRSALEQIVILLRERTGNDFSLYKKNTIYRRIERRMGLHQIKPIALYVSYLRENPHELDLLFKELLIGVTQFFRDSEVWEQFKSVALPTLFDKYPEGKGCRAWVPACSSGEEAYSLAMTFMDALAEAKTKGPFSLQIFATDLDADAVDIARQAHYPMSIEADVTPEQLTRYFVKDEMGYRVNKIIREMVIFAPQNIIMDPPFTKLDILTCRNLLIYLGPELQKQLIPLFHYTLLPQGILLLGNAETIGSFSDLFTPINEKARLFASANVPAQLRDIDFPTRTFPIVNWDKKELEGTSMMSISINNLQTQADQILLQNYAPAAVLVNVAGDILYINGRTGKYLEPAAGKANWNIHAMAREGIQHEISLALKRAQTQVDPVHIPNLTVGSNGSTQTLDLTVQAIAKPKTLCDLLMVVFTDVITPAKSPRRKAGAAEKEIQGELQETQQEVRTLRDQMQSSQEELKSTNEELQSTNEELQSTNEELTTSKEEMQSMNEELQSVNNELQSKVDDLSWTNNDMKNLLNSTEIATVFLDDQLNVRRFTVHATHLFKLIQSDLGRPLSDIVTELDYAELQQDATEVLKTLVFIEKQVMAKGKRWFKVRVMPYRTQDNVISGVVITFTDITDLKLLETELQRLKKA